MQVIVSCPDCSRQLRLPEEVMGQSVRCPLCKVVFTARNPEAKPPASPAGKPAEDDLPLLPLAEDDEPPRRERPEPRRRDRDRDERTRRPARESEDRRPARRPSPTRGFALFVHHDPLEKLAGEFKAEFDADGLTFWRGRGREIVVPFGSAAEYLGDGRLLLEVEGRKVEASAVHRDGMNDELARAVLHALGDRDAKFKMPLLPRGKVVWLALLPLALPLVAWAFGDGIAGVAGMVSFSVLGAVLAGLALIFVMQRRMATSTRAWTALCLALGGSLVLAIALRVDHSGPPEPPLDFSHWIAFAPIDGGFSAEFPGLPENTTGLPNTQPLHHALTHRYSLELGGRTNLVAGYGVVVNTPPVLNDLNPGRAVLNGGQILKSRRPVNGNDLQGVEVEFTTNDGRSGVARYFVKDNRLFGITFVSRRLSPTCKEAQRFLDSFAFDPTTGWPGPGTTGLKPIGVAPNVPGFPNDPRVDPNLPGTKLVDGTLLLSHTFDFVWAGYRANTNEVIAVGYDGLVYVCDDTGRKLRQVTVDPGGRTSKAALSPDGKRLAVVGSMGKLVLLDVDTLKPKELRPNSVNGFAPSDVAFSSDNKFLNAVQEDRTVCVWDLDKSVVVKRFPLPPEPIGIVAFDPTGKELVCGDNRGTLYHLDAADGRVITRLPGHTFSIRSLAMGADGTIISGGHDRQTRLWKLPSPKPKKVFNHQREVSAVAFHPAGRLALVAEANGWVHLFESGTYNQRGGVVRQRPPLVQYTNRGVSSVAWHATADKILVADGSRLEAWDLSRVSPFRPGDLVPVAPRKPSGPSELRDRGKLLEHQFALVCPEKKCALLFTADKKVHRYSYPEWKPTKTSPFPIAVRSAALDAGTGTLYAVEVDPRPQPKAKGEIRAYDIAGLLDDKALPAGLEPKQTLEAGAAPRDLLLDASGKSLYYVEGSFSQFAVRRLDTTAFDDPETLLEKKWTVHIGMSPDRKTLCVLSSAGGRRTLTRFEAATRRKVKESAVAPHLEASLSVGADRVLLRGVSGMAFVDLAAMRLTPLRSTGNFGAFWIAPTGTRIFSEWFEPHILNAYDVPAGATALPEPAFTMEIQEPYRNPFLSAPTFSPDGRFLLFPSGRLIGLGKDARPAEPNPEP